MVRKTALAALLLIAGCAPSPVEKAKRDVEFLERNGGSGGELCEARTRLADAYRQAGDAEQWREAKQYAYHTCLNEELARRLNS